MMAMLRFLYRKMWNTRWLTFSTLFGLIVAVAFTTSIPMYADGALKRVVTKTLQANSDGGMPPGSLLIRYQAAGSDRPDPAAVKDVDTYISKQLPKDIGYPPFAYAASWSIRSAALTPVDPKKVDPSKRRQMTLTDLSGLKDKVDLVQGQFYGDASKDGVIEAVVLDEAMYRDDLHVGDEFVYPIAGGLGIAPLKVRIVGSVKPKQDTDPYWYQGLDSLMNTLFVSDPVFRQELLQGKNIPLSLANWYYAFDLRQIQVADLSSLDRKLSRLDINLYSKLKDTRVDISFRPLLSEFAKQSLQLQLLLLMLAAPMLAMVFYYIAMNARQALERQRVDIAVLRSRGGSTRQIFMIFLLEGLILGLIALIVGPFIGWFMAKCIGSSSGFLTFVDRESIPIGITRNTVLYGGLAVLIAIVATVIPALQFAKATIVGYKQEQARTDRKPFWQRFYLDVLLVLLSGYGWYSFQQEETLARSAGLTSDQLQVQPLTFVVPALAIFSLGLLVLRLFPWLLRLISWLLQRVLSIGAYLTLTQLSRSAKSYYPLMLLIMLTLGLGVYNASAARTIDLNSTERILYQYGTDVIMTAQWEGVTDDLPTEQPQDSGQDQGQAGGAQGPSSGQGQGQVQGQGQPPATDSGPPPRMRYVEPPFEVFRSLNGVEAAARVLQTKANIIVSGRSLGQGNVMGIDNVDFAKVAWFRRDLYPYHPFQYLNLLGTYEQAALVSQTFADKYSLKPGDLFQLAINQQPVEFVVVATLPYWPAEYPDQSPFFIVNLDYVYDQVPMLPYDVWLKMKPDAKVAPLIDVLRTNHVELASIKDVRNELIAEKNHPSRAGVFGILSLGFLVSVFVSLIGFVLYWFFHLSRRVVQFGVLRAMGLKRRQLTLMLLLEQLFTAGLAVASGIGLGKLASYLYLPFLQTTEDAKSQVPPFRIVFNARDTLQLYAVTLVMIALGALILLTHIRRLRVHQAVKLGEER